MGHGHSHHPPADFSRALAVGIALNTVFVAVEAYYGWRAGSLALLADAGHNLSDVGGLLLAWAGLFAGRLRPDDRHTYGWRRGSILAGFANAAILLVAMGSLAWEALGRLRAPAAVDAGTVMAVAAVGVLVNGVSAALFASGARENLNIRGAFLHMAADALVSAGVVLAGALSLWFGWTWIDPVMSIVIALVIVFGTWSLFSQSVHLLFDGVPAHIALGEVREGLCALSGVRSVHDLHVWAMAASETALTAHLVLEPGARAGHDDLLRAAGTMLHDRFGIHHVTLQVESEGCEEFCGPA